MSDHADIVRKAIRMHPDASTDEIWESETEAFAALDALVAERDEANVQWHKIRDLHADAISEVSRLRVAMGVIADYYEAVYAPGDQAYQAVILIRAALAPTKEEGT
jgi:hypothetical protein